jgi:hypothetical protein
VSGRIHKSRIPIRSHASLAPEVREEIANAKNALKAGPALPFFDNLPDRALADGPPLPVLSDGCRYFELQVGEAHPDDSRPRGRRRLVLEVHQPSRRILEIYYTENHYAKFTFVRII